MADIGPLLGEGIRRAVRAHAPLDGSDRSGPDTILLDGENSIQATSPSARRALSSLIEVSANPGSLPLAVVSVADVARRAARGETGEVASARVPTRDGGWLLLHAVVVDGDPADRVAVTLATPHRPEVAGLILEACGLSRREREVTELVLRGCSTSEIAGSLGVSTYTVQDHLKSIFAKVGVRSRRELVARVFFDYYAPRIAAGSEPGADGWFRNEEWRSSR